MLSRGPRIFLVFLLMWASASAFAADALRVVVAPFGPKGTPEGELAEGLELELELNARIVLSAPGAVVSALHAPASEAFDDDISAALLADGQDFMVRGVPTDGGRLVILVHRAKDGRPVFGTEIDVGATKKDPSGLALELGRVFRRDTKPLSPDELKALFPVKEIAKTPPVDDGKTGKTDTPPQDDWDSAVVRADKAKTEEPATAVDEPNTPPPWARVLRLNVYYAPTTVSYSACQPNGGAGALPFLCNRHPDVPSSDGLLVAPVGAALSLRAFPWVPWVGFELDASLLSGSVRLPASTNYDWVTTNDVGLTDNRLDVIGLNARGGVLGRAMLRFDPVWLGVGGHAGYLLQLMLSKEHYLKNPTNTIAAELLPSYRRHSAYVGLNLELGMSPFLRASLDLDVLPLVFEEELTTTIAAGSLLGAGGHARLQIDGQIAFGLMVSAFIDGVATSTSGSGVGTRDTRREQPFEGGSATGLAATMGLGVGYFF